MPFLIPDFPSAIRAPSPLSVRPLAGIIHRCDDTVAQNGDGDRGLSLSLSPPPTIDPFYDRLDTARKTSLTLRASVPCTRIARSQEDRGASKSGPTWLLKIIFNG